MLEMSEPAVWSEGARAILLEARSLSALEMVPSASLTSDGTTLALAFLPSTEIKPQTFYIVAAVAPPGAGWASPIQTFGGQASGVYLSQDFQSNDTPISTAADSFILGQFSTGASSLGPDKAAPPAAALEANAPAGTLDVVWPGLDGLDMGGCIFKGYDFFITVAGSDGGSPQQYELFGNGAGGLVVNP